MRINFFEEYPTSENMEKARFIDFPSTVYIAARSLKEFYTFKDGLLGINPNLDAAYWPLLPHTYWFSPFSYTEDLEKFIEEMKSNNNPLAILLDLELPLQKHWQLYFRNFFVFFKNKKLLRQFIEKAPTYNIHIVTAEYPPLNNLVSKLYRILGISYNPQKYGHTSCIMYYSSMISSSTLFKKITKTVIHIKEKENSNLELGLGTIATGVLGNEPILSTQNLERDLKLIKDHGFQTATIFRLGGLTTGYYEIIRKYADK